MGRLGCALLPLLGVGRCLLRSRFEAPSRDGDFLDICISGLTDLGLAVGRAEEGEGSLCLLGLLFRESGLEDILFSMPLADSAAESARAALRSLPWTPFSMCWCFRGLSWRLDRGAPPSPVFLRKKLKLSSLASGVCRFSCSKARREVLSSGRSPDTGRSTT